MTQFQKTTLDSGLRVLSQRHHDVHSVNVGVWIHAGAVYENDDERGLAHLLEHLVFKGTQKRSMTQIARAMDDIGGQMNAFTERELVCYHVKVLSDHLPRALELLCDFVARPTLAQDQLDLERGVVLEEIKGVEDEPEEWVSDLFAETLWPNSRWGRPILGTAESVSKLSTDDLRRFMCNHYTPRDVVVAATGDVDHEKLVKLSQKLLKDLPTTSSTRSASIPAAPKVCANNAQIERETEQVHLCIGTQGFAVDDDRRYASFLLDSILTGGYSSRLFQEIREKRGLCYSIGGTSVSYRTTGMWAVETSCAPKSARKVVEIISRELRRVRDKGVTKSEWKRAQEMARINVLLAEESVGAQMNRIARNELYLGRQKPLQETLRDLQNVSIDDVQAVANEMFQAETINLAAIGPLEKPLCVEL